MLIEQSISYSFVGTVMNRVGEPEDIGGLCIYLASSASSWMTGALIPMDGGVLVSARM